MGTSFLHTPTPARKTSVHPLKRLLCTFLSLTLLVTLAHADQTELSVNSHRWTCAGVYEKADILGGSDPSIKVEVTAMTDPSNSQVIIFNWDEDAIKESLEDSCTADVLQSNGCSPQAYARNLYPYAGKETHVEFMANKTAPYKISYPVKTTGFYCVTLSLPKGNELSANVDWRNPYGEVPAEEYPKLPFYGIVSIIYLCLGVIWMIKCALHWRDILPIQHYISGIMFFLMVEMSITYGYWAKFNATGEMSTPLLALTVVLNAARNSLSFFMLLIVALGYGVVKPTLGSTMNKCLGLMYTHFFFGTLYAAGGMLTSLEASGLFILLFVLPLSVTMTMFYTWTFQALKDTISALEVRRQSVKTLMYRRLFRILALSVAFVCLFFVISVLNFSRRADENWPARHWRYKWFLTDGWLNILYLIVFWALCYLWRPTSNNQRYGLEELATDEASADAADLESGTATGTAGQSIKLCDVPRSRSESPHRRSSDDGGNGAIFDIGDAVDEWLEENSSTRNDERRPEDQRSLVAAQSKLN